MYSQWNGPVHPHVHGELRSHYQERHWWIGSSPRAWGTHASRPRVPRRSRFIPTCMGNSSLRQAMPIQESVHPHVHGELSDQYCILPSAHGSSPRAWGTLNDRAWLVQRYRFIPTCMGNSSPAAISARSGSVHPHVHGELFAVVGMWMRSIGSSPRAWGTRVVVEEDLVCLRFIPTCMGNSNDAPGRKHFLPVHPHVHGELT